MVAYDWSSVHGLRILAGYLNLECGRVKVGQPVRKFAEWHLDSLKKMKTKMRNIIRKEEKINKIIKDGKR